MGNEVSYNEIASLSGENVHTIKRYIEILEQAFVIFRLPSFSQNLRKELGKRNKIYYFWRTYSQKEIDFIEEAEGKLAAFEFKWEPKKNIKPPNEFLNAYPESDFNVISRKAYIEFISGNGS